MTKQPKTNRTTKAMTEVRLIGLLNSDKEIIWEGAISRQAFEKENHFKVGASKHMLEKRGTAKNQKTGERFYAIYLDKPQFIPLTKKEIANEIHNLKGIYDKSRKTKVPICAHCTITDKKYYFHTGVQAAKKCEISQYMISNFLYGRKNKDGLIWKRWDVRWATDEEVKQLESGELKYHIGEQSP